MDLVRNYQYTVLTIYLDRICFNISVVISDNISDKSTLPLYTYKCVSSKMHERHTPDR